MQREKEKDKQPCFSLVVNPPSWEMLAFLGAIRLQGKGFLLSSPRCWEQQAALHQAQLWEDSSASFACKSY